MPVYKDCAHCGQTFSCKPSHAHKKRYCSQDCMAADYRVRMRGSANPNWTAAGARTCAYCGGPYTSHQPDRHYCSMRCGRAAKYGYRQTRLPGRLTTPAPRSRVPCRRCGEPFFPSRTHTRICPTCFEKRVERSCEICGTTFRVRYDNQVAGRKTCSRSCESELRAAHQRGDRSHRWEGGKTSDALILRSSWEYAEWRSAIFRRDGFTCAMCGEQGGKLCAHHIKTFADHPEYRLETWNGITLCWPCHASLRGHEPEHEERFFQIVAERDKVDTRVLPLIRNEEKTR